MWDVDLNNATDECKRFSTGKARVPTFCINDENKLKSLALMIQPRVDLTTELWQELKLFFEKPEVYDPKALKKVWKENVLLFLRKRDRRAGLDSSSSAPTYHVPVHPRSLRRELPKEIICSSTNINNKGACCH